MNESQPPSNLSSKPPQRKSPWLAVYADLFKARLTSLVLLTTLVGFYLGFRGPVDFALMFRLLLGTAFLASGAAALNQLLEREYDAKMRRTQDRPLPSGRLQPQTVLMVGCASALVGLLYLAQAVNLTTSLVGATSLVCYLFVYTPLKRVTWLNTLVGAVPGALPPLMGWTAARGELSSEGLALFAIQAFWQLPHFMAIAWIYREEYARAGFQDAAGRGSRRPPHGPPGRQLHARVAGGEPVPVPVQFDRPHLPGGRVDPRAGFCGVRLPVFPRADGRARAAALLRLAGISPVAVGGDGAR